MPGQMGQRATLRRNSVLRCAALAALLGAGGCYVGLAQGPGEDESDTAAPGSASGDASDPTGEPADDGCGPAVARNVAKISDREYTNSVRALLGDPEFRITVQSPGASPGAFIEDAATQSVNYALAVQYQGTAEAAGAQVEADPSRVGFTCLGAVSVDPCVRAWIQDFAGRAFRQPLDPDQAEAYASLFTAGAVDGIGAGVGLVVEAVLQSPQFLYRRELGESIANDGSTELSATEVAERVAFWLTETIPDPELWELALTGAIREPDVLRAQVQRLQTSAAGRRTLTHAIVRWLHLSGVDQLDKDPELFAGFPGARTALLESAQRTIEDALAGDGDDVGRLLTTNSTYVNDAIAPLFGLEPVGSSSLVPIDLPDGERSGILTHPALLAALAHYDQTSIVARGAMIRQQLLCNELPPPIEIDAEAVGAGMTPREFAEYRLSDPACRGCHQLMEPFGFIFESYDAVGRYQTTMDGQPIDTVGEVTATDFDGSYSSVPELAQALAQSDQVSRCVTQHMLALGLGTKAADTTCAVDELVDQFPEAPELDELIPAIALSAAFRTRGE